MTKFEVGKFYKLDYTLWGAPTHSNDITVFKILKYYEYIEQVQGGRTHYDYNYQCIFSNSTYFHTNESHFFSDLSCTAESLIEISQEEVIELMLSI